jgi:exopolysaccharide biosynthesis protein
VELTPGGPGHYSASKSWYEQITARTAIGVSQDGRRLVLFTVDGRGGSLGMKVSEMADLLIKDYAVYDGLNLDGGGSTSMAMEGKLVNVSMDSAMGRKVGSSFAVFSK